jgi:hypothetical protein
VELRLIVSLGRKLTVQFQRVVKVAGQQVGQRQVAPDPGGLRGVLECRAAFLDGRVVLLLEENRSYALSSVEVEVWTGVPAGTS